MFLTHKCCYLQDEIGLKEWSLSLRSAHKCSSELLGSMAKKAGKIYGTERDKTQVIPRTTNGNQVEQPSRFSANVVSFVWRQFKAQYGVSLKYLKLFMVLYENVALIQDFLPGFKRFQLLIWHMLSCECWKRFGITLHNITFQ